MSQCHWVESSGVNSYALLFHFREYTCNCGNFGNTFPPMNLPNAITILRTVFAFASVVLLCFSTSGYFASAAFVLYVVAGVSDFLDGYIARRCNVVTVFGKYMDALSDKIMVVSLFLALFAFDMFGAWTVFALFCAIISMTREFVVSGIRMIASVKGVVIAAEKVGKYKAAFQMYSLGAIIFAHALVLDFNAANSVLWSLAFYSGIATLAVSTLLSMWSGVGYGVKYSYLLKE